MLGILADAQQRTHERGAYEVNARPVGCELSTVEPFYKPPSFYMRRVCARKSTVYRPVSRSLASLLQAKVGSLMYDDVCSVN
jgi:hypothetical protein